ncbi:unnamed protein product [Mycena citricolor]|uniref:Cupin type-1 domain-containing protein n=1 Tax=Mycena citricolor TaxID=2018698 RepID=A0AAD2Q2J2_9AGAR|nr:unnamed protein product [Mycena citricolor]
MPNGLRTVSVALLLTLGAHAASSAPAPTSQAELISALKNAPTANDRIALLSKDSDFVFDFADPAKKATKGAGGSIVLANAASFPAVIGLNSAMATGFLDACAMNTPHTHPRATEMLISVNGTLRTGMITENGARFVVTALHPGAMTVFPIGSIHFQVNDGCAPVQFVSSFNGEDPGGMQVAQRLFGLAPDVVSATLGDIGVEIVAGLDAQIPDNVIAGTAECLKRCGITRPAQGTTQRQPRVSGNAFPSGVSASMYSKPTGAPPISQTAASKPSATRMTHLIKVGANGLTFTPSNIQAAVGDKISFEFHPKNHTVTQSNFANPCMPLQASTGVAGFKSGFMPVSASATTFPTFKITVNDTNPIWGYCGQQGPPVHCTSGMVFSINAPATGPRTFSAFLALAKTNTNTNTTAASSKFAVVSDLSSSGKPLPTLFVILIAVIGALVLALLGLGVYLVRVQRRSRRAGQRQLYTSVGAPLFAAAAASVTPTLCLSCFC